MVLAENLRQAVLQAALQGKLTKQLETDSDVDEMLINIQAEKKKLIAEKKIKKEKSLPEIQEEDIPFDIPENWRWVRLGDVVKTISAGGDKPKNFSKEKTELFSIPVIANGETNDGILGYTDEALIKEKSLTVSGRGTIGFSIVRTEPYVPIVRLLVITALKQTNLYYVQCVLKSLIEVGIGTAVKQLTVPMIQPKVIPLPPIEEQQRIVDKINEIMSKIDEYEKVEKELEALKKEFPTNMKDALLQAAMQGKLTEQLEGDSSVDELLEAIRQEKEELIAQKKIKKEKASPDIEEEEIPFDIPENWRWVRLGNVGTLTRGNGIKRNEVTEVGFPCVRYGELYTTYKTKFDVAVSHTSKEIFNKSQKVHTNDILMALTGENNFDIALALAYLGEEVIAMGGDLTRWSNHHMNPLYLVYVMNSSYAIHKKSEMAKGDIIVHISNDKLATILLPIPPIEEQNRIVERLEALLPLCEDLREV